MTGSRPVYAGVDVGASRTKVAIMSADAQLLGQAEIEDLGLTPLGEEYVGRLDVTVQMAGVVKCQHALDELAFLLEIPSPVTVAILRLDPTWRPLDGEPRFQELLERFAA